MVVWGGAKGDGDKRLRKNLAYYDHDVYDALKLRKQQNVSIILTLVACLLSWKLSTQLNQFYRLGF